MTIEKFNKKEQYKPSLDLILNSKSVVDMAKKIAKTEIHKSELGKFIGVFRYEKRAAAYYFESTKLGYKSWFWEITLSRKPLSKQVTFSELNLIASDKSPVGKSWIPFQDRLTPKDIKHDIQLPFRKDDRHLSKGYGKQFNPNQVKGSNINNLDELKEITSKYYLTRERVLSSYGKNEAFNRWYHSGRGKSGNGSSSCSNCGFFVPLAGKLGQGFGACSSQWSQDDGKVVSIDHNCGANSESGVQSIFDRYRAGRLVLDESIESLNK